MARQPVGRGVEAAQECGHRLGPFLPGISVHGRLVGEGDQSPVARGAEAHPLARRGAHPDQLKDLLPGHRDLDRLLQLPSSEHREDRLGMDCQLGAESPADVRRDDVDPLRVHPERIGNAGTGRSDDLRADVGRQLLPLPMWHCQASIRFHRLVRRRVALIDFDLGAGEGGVEIAHRGVGRNSQDQRLRRVRLILACGEVVVSRLRGVLDVDETGCRSCLLEGRRDHERHWLAVMVNVGAAQFWLRDPVWQGDAWVGVGMPCAGAFRCVITSSTPAARSARVVSIRAMRPLPIVAPTMKP